jgi:hypothetical protein
MYDIEPFADDMSEGWGGTVIKDKLGVGRKPYFW